MAKATLKKVVEIMKNLDICMMTTVKGSGITASRPMSNNAEVEYSGTSYYFTWKKSKTVKDISKNPHVNLSFTGSKMLKKVYVSVEARAKLIENKKAMQDHWSKDLEVWFKDGIDTPGIVMIEAKAKRIKYWHGMEEGELKL